MAELFFCVLTQSGPLPAGHNCQVNGCQSRKAACHNYQAHRRAAGGGDRPRGGVVGGGVGESIGTPSSSIARATLKNIKVPMEACETRCSLPLIRPRCRPEAEPLILNRFFICVRILFWRASVCMTTQEVIQSLVACSCNSKIRSTSHLVA
jgi:hypothetical protein